MFIFPVQLTTSRIGNLTRLIHTLLYVMTIHTYIHIQPPRYHRTAIIFLDISRKAGPLPPIAFALSAYYSYILHIYMYTAVVLHAKPGQPHSEQPRPQPDRLASGSTGRERPRRSGAAHCAGPGGAPCLRGQGDQRLRRADEVVERGHSGNSEYGSGPRVDVLVHDLLPEVQTLLEVLVEDMNTRGLGRATSKVEKICLVLDPRYKSCCKAVCLNGGQQLRESVTALVEGKLSSFTGSVASGGSAGADASSSGGPGASASGSGGSGAGANSSGRDNGAGSPEAAGTGAVSRAGGAGSPAPTAPISRMDRRKAQRDKKVARPPGDVDASESRADVAEREFNAYMKEAAPSNSSDFDLLQYWATRSVDGINPSGKVLVPARWPHIGLLARLYAGVDTTTSCQAERNFSG